ncbi:MAG TPA: polysaccharide deacetylase [Blastocatellia bacterium]|nr:polysaccharide deacetylase [Blastocatellia bacterium]
MKSQEIRFDKGVFVISLDLELIWGTLDLFGPARFRSACEVERRVVIDRLLDLFTEFDISATWCVLGHLLLDECAAEGSRKHPEIVRPGHDWVRHDWFEHDPCGRENDDSIFLGRSLVEKIQACPVAQEIGCHSFSHVIFGDSGCSRETAESEVRACLVAAEMLGIRMRSFAFPRNSAGHLDVLAEHGFTSYRGAEPHWYEQAAVPNAMRRLARLAEVVTVTKPPTVLPEITPCGLWNVPGSMIYFPLHGFRRYVPVSWRVKRAVKGLGEAARRNRIFHLWFHPTNLAYETDAAFSGLRQILEHARALRRQGRLEILPMGSIISAHDSFDLALGQVGVNAQ